MILLAAFALHTSAQSPRKVLDATAARLTKSGDVKAQFKATQFNGTTPEGEAQGTMLMSGTRFYMKTEQVTAWFDGKTQWSLMQGSREVNVSEPDEDDLQEMNPALLVNIYKQGFNYRMSKSTLRGRPTYVVHLWPSRKDTDYSDIFVDVDQATYDPLCIRAKRNGNWVRLSILTFQTGLQLPAATFTFPKQDYPDIEVIDLR